MHRRLIELDPLNPENHWNWGWANFWARRYDEAAKIFNSLLEHAPEDHWLEMALGLTYLHLDLPDRALEMSQKARTGVPLGLDMQFDCFTAFVFGTVGMKEPYRAFLKPCLVPALLIALAGTLMVVFSKKLAFLTVF